MFELQGKYNSAKIFSDNIESGAIAQIINLLNQEFAQGSQIRFMPDAHVGMSGTIGTSMTITDKAVPNLVGVDIGCGMETAILQNDRIELEKLDRAIHENIPAGFSVRSTPHQFTGEIDLCELRCAEHVDISRAMLSIGSLGGGNHFIEVGKDRDGRLYLIVHSGSRSLGGQVARFYQDLAAKRFEPPKKLIKKMIGDLKARGRQQDIEEEVKKLLPPKVDRHLAYLEGGPLSDYIHDMALTQRFADLNRKAIVQVIASKMGFKVEDSFTSVHNYIDTESMILRKGAISAKAGERMLIPINMRDGSLICVGKGNPDWNLSAPHGAGRLMSRSAARESITLARFMKAMEGVYTTTANKSTIDEAPFAYKPMDEIIGNIGDTAEVKKILKPIYNFKASEY
ncbi:MAG: RtcB family protein [Clostridiales bacterium]|jgi:RNA-splicing ligase RtcB|nr:RtcB family protein [Clostridiales bacterium]